MNINITYFHKLLHFITVAKKIISQLPLRSLKYIF